MEKITIGDYEITLTGKMDGSVHDMEHWTHKEFYSIQQIHSVSYIIGAIATLGRKERKILRGVS